jgi:hypothetical protein
MAVTGRFNTGLDFWIDPLQQDNLSDQQLAETARQFTTSKNPTFTQQAGPGALVDWSGRSLWLDYRWILQPSVENPYRFVAGRRPYLKPTASAVNLQTIDVDAPFGAAGIQAYPLGFGRTWVIAVVVQLDGVGTFTFDGPRSRLTISPSAVTARVRPALDGTVSFSGLGSGKFVALQSVDYLWNRLAVWGSGGLVSSSAEPCADWGGADYSAIFPLQKYSLRSVNAAGCRLYETLAFKTASPDFVRSKLVRYFQFKFGLTVTE